MTSKNFKNKNFDARTLALKALLSIISGQGSQAVVDNYLKKYYLNLPEQSLLNELVYGTLRFYFRIDSVLNKILPKLNNLPDLVQMILRMSSYEIIFLYKIPEYATVNFAVQKTKEVYDVKLSQVVNGALRSVLRFDDEIYNKSFYKKSCDFFSMPSWLYGYFVKNYGVENSQQLMKSFLKRPSKVIRLNPLHSKYEELNFLFKDKYNFIPVGYSGFILPDKDVLRTIDELSFDKLQTDGALSWQGAGSQIILKKIFEACPYLKNIKFWDACAGQGGKTLALTEQGVKIEIVSDISLKRLKLLKKNIHRLNLKQPKFVCANFCDDWNFYSNYKWDGSILLDVPCSGFGTLLKKPEIKILRKYEDVQDLILLQSKMLNKSINYLSENQYIVYITCTYNPFENEKLINDFLSKNTNIRKKMECHIGFEDNCEGMYAAVLEKI